VFILKDEQLWFIQDKSTFHKENFHIDKEYISVNTKSKNTEKQQCVHLGVRDSASTNLLFPEKLLISLLTNQNLITVDSKRTEQNSFGYLKCSNPNKSPSNADANFESTKIKNLTFLKHCLSQTMVCLKAKSLSKTRQYNQLEKSSRKFGFAKQNYA